MSCRVLHIAMETWGTHLLTKIFCCERRLVTMIFQLCRAEHRRVLAVWTFNMISRSTSSAVTQICQSHQLTCNDVPQERGHCTSFLVNVFMSTDLPRTWKCYTGITAAKDKLLTLPAGLKRIKMYSSMWEIMNKS